MSRASKKERHRLKRKEKQALARRRNSVSPFARLKHSSGQIECWMNREWDVMHQASVYVIRELGGGRVVFAAFLVDLGVRGLIDAWGRFDMTRGEILKEMIEPFRERMEADPVSLDQATRMVAGGIRFAHDNGLRLPKGYEKWLRVLGDVDWKNADTSAFIMEYAGTVKELKERLIGYTLEEFLARDDIKFTMRYDSTGVFNGDFDFDLEDQDDEADVEEFDDGALMSEAIDLLRQRGVEAVRQWCFERTEAAHPRLEEAVEVFLEASTMATGDELRGAEGGNPFAAAMELHQSKDPRSLQEAMEQLQRFVTSFENAETFLDAMLSEEQPPAE